MKWATWGTVLTTNVTVLPGTSALQTRTRACKADLASDPLDLPYLATDNAKIPYPLENWKMALFLPSMYVQDSNEVSERMLVRRVCPRKFTVLLVYEDQEFPPH